MNMTFEIGLRRVSEKFLDYKVKNVLKIVLKNRILIVA